MDSLPMVTRCAEAQWRGLPEGFRNTILDLDGVCFFPPPRPFDDGYTEEWIVLWEVEAPWLALQQRHLISLKWP